MHDQSSPANQLTTPTIAIVGAGLLGRLLSLYLSSSHRVTLFEKDTLANTETTGRIAAAMVAPTAESVVASNDITQMGYQALKLWPALLSELELQTPFQASGSIIVAHRPDVNDLRHFAQRVKPRIDFADKSNDERDIEPDLFEISPAQVTELEPELASHFAKALWLPNEGHIDNGKLYEELEQKLLTSRVEICQHCEVEINNNLVTITNAPSDEDSNMQFDWVIDCRGLGAKGKWLTTNNSLRGVRGEVIRVHAPEVNLTRPIRLMHPRYPIYIVPKANNHYVIGATEIESEDNKGASVRSVLELLSAAYSVHKGFAEAEISQIQSGLRPTLLDNEPAIVRNNKHIQVNGLYRHGFMLAPSIIQQTIALLITQGLNVSPLTAPTHIAPKTNATAKAFINLGSTNENIN